MKGPERFGINIGDTPLGKGSERKVYQDPANEGRVLAIQNENTETPNTIKGQYYLGKILHLLFPLNTADVHAAYSEPNTTVRQKIELHAEHAAFQDALTTAQSYSDDQIRKIDRLSKKLERSIPAHAYEELVKNLQNLGLYIDDHPVNFALDSAGNLQYVEVPLAFNARGRCYSPTALVFAIEKLPPAQQEEAMTYLERLEALYREESKHQDVRRAA